MGKNELKGVIKPLSSPVKEVMAIEINSPSSEGKGTPLRSIFCLKKKENMREIEEREDCFILEFDPNDSFDLSKFSLSKDLHNPDSPDLSVLAETGQVACRDYPHSRHHCLENPFEKTPHDSYCKLCYCFVCDMAAPCKSWFGATGHCHAIDDKAWKSLRKARRNLNK